LASDRKQKEPSNERQQRRRIATLCARIAMLRTRIATLEGEVTMWKGEARTWQDTAQRLALNSAHLMFDTPAALPDAELALADRKLTKQDLDAERRELRKAELALPHRDKITRTLRIGGKLHTKVQDYTIAVFVTAAMEAIARGEALQQDESRQYWRGRKDVIGNAAKTFGLGERTIEEALARHRATEANSKSPQ
jgi:hypothetical protein